LTKFISDYIFAVWEKGWQPRATRQEKKETINQK